MNTLNTSGNAMTFRIILRTVGLMLLLWAPLFSFGQITLPSEEVAYYFDINTATAGNPLDVQKNVMNLKYFDKLGQTKDFILNIYDWQQNEVAQLQLDKSYGINYYTVDLKDIYSGWELNKIYRCEFYDEVHKKHAWSFRLIETPKVADIELNIIVNPINLTCNELEESHVEFYGEIKGGRAPFTTTWYIMNNNRSEFLYQPKDQKLKEPGATPVVLVDSKPDYYVMLYVKDACGNIEQKMVHLVCEEKRKKINTLFVEPMQTTETNTKNTH